MLRKIFGLKREEVKGEWSKLHSKLLHDLYCSSDNIDRVIISREMRWVGHVARMGQGIWWENLDVRDRYKT